MPRVTVLGEREEQVLECDRLRRQRTDQRPGLDQRLRQLGDGRLVGGERDPPRLGALIGDARLRSAHRERALVVGGRQPVGRPGAALELGDRALIDDLPRAHDPDPVADLLDLGHQVAGEQYGHPLPRQPANQQAHVAHAPRVKPGGGFVEQQQLGLAQQRRGDPKALAHAVRVAADAIPGAVGELDGVQGGVDPPARVAAVERGQQLQVAPPGQVRVERRRLDEAGHARERADGHLRVAPEQAHRSLRRPDQAEHHPQRGGLPGAVGPEVSVDVARVDGQIDAPDCGQVAVALDEPAHLYGRRAVNRVDRHRARAAASAAAAGTEPSTV